MSKCVGCGKEYNHYYNTCPKCRGFTHDGILDHIDDGIDLNREQDIIYTEIEEREQRDSPRERPVRLPKRKSKGFDISKMPYPESILKQIAKNKEAKIIDVGDEDNGNEKS
jgi:Zn-finger nucleic acid-binding protein